MACYAFYSRAISRWYGSYCLYLYVWDTYDHKLTNIMSVSYQQTPSLLAFGWICHAFAFIYMYSWHTIIQAYHAYLNSGRPNINHEDYLSFNFRLYLFYLFTIVAYHTTFRFRYQYIFIRTHVPLPEDTIFYFVRVGLGIDSDLITH